MKDIIQIDFKSRKPIYEQLVHKVKELIIKGIMEEGEKLPSVRSVSKELGVNPNTVQKAYRELESQEYIISIKGKGSYVSSRGEVITQKEKNRIKDEVRKALTEAIYSGITIDDIKDVVKEFDKEEG